MTGRHNEDRVAANVSGKGAAWGISTLLSLQGLLVLLRCFRLIGSSHVSPVVKVAGSLYHSTNFMALSVAQAFESLKEKLEITDLQAATVSTRQTNVREALEDNLGVLDTFLTGSYRRNTMIAPLAEADVDIFVVLKSEYFHHYNGQNGSQAGLIDYVKQTLRKTYTKTPDISRNGQAVTIRFSDFLVDVVPGFNREGGGFLIPNAISQTWIGTDPKKHVEIFTQANTKHGGDFIPLVKMLKAWNKNSGQYFRSFHLEVMALQILDNVTISDFPSGLRYFFDKAREKVKVQTADPAGYSGDVGAYIATGAEIQEAAAKFQTAYDRSAKAEDYGRRAYASHAIDTWKQVFGDYFPGYY